jgi:hypothetical protein
MSRLVPPRYYNRTIGQFISADPIGLAGGIKSMPIGGNPICATDPLGLQEVVSRPLFITDAAITIKPSLDDKRDICQNAINLARIPGIHVATR